MVIMVIMVMLVFRDTAEWNEIIKLCLTPPRHRDHASVPRYSWTEQDY